MQTSTKEKMEVKTEEGTVKQIIGAVVDVYFASHIPEVYTALRVEGAGGGTTEKKTVILETASH